MPCLRSLRRNLRSEWSASPLRDSSVFGDLAALHFVTRRIGALAPDVLHGHGAKGAALARLVPRSDGAIRVYTPHGGSLVYAPGTIAGGFYRALERLLNWRTDLFLFESSYIAQEYLQKNRAAARAEARRAQRDQ